MIAFWSVVRECDVEAYAASLLLPGYLAHLQLTPVRICEQPRVCDGREPLVLTYLGEGRLEQFSLDPETHALGLIQRLLPGIDTSRIQLPRDDAAWLWPAPDDGRALRVYFTTAAAALNRRFEEPLGQHAYVSISRQLAFIGRSVVECYLRAWLEHLQIPHQPLAVALEGASGAVEFRAGPVGGQLLVDDPGAAEDLLRFARLDRWLAELADLVELDAGTPQTEPYGVRPDGVYFRLARK